MPVMVSKLRTNKVILNYLLEIPRGYKYYLINYAFSCNSESIKPIMKITELTFKTLNQYSKHYHWFFQLQYRKNEEICYLKIEIISKKKCECLFQSNEIFFENRTIKS